MCFETSLAAAGTIRDATVGCYHTRCQDDKLEVKVDVSGNEVWLPCDSPGATMSVSGLNGEITCPSLAFELLCQPHACPGLPCDGLTTCNGGACTCGPAFGTSCGSSSSALSSNSNCSYPPPAMPPAAPGGTYVSVVSFTLTASVDISAFDQGAFKTNLATYLDVPESSIKLTVTSGSVLINVEITLADASQASSVASVVRSASTTQLTSALGVEITHVSDVTVTLRLQDPPSPPESNLIENLSLFISIGAGMFVACICCCCVCLNRDGIIHHMSLSLWARQSKKKAHTGGPTSTSVEL